MALLSGSIVVRCITRYVRLFDNLHNNVWLLVVSLFQVQQSNKLYRMCNTLLTLLTQSRADSAR